MENLIVFFRKHYFTNVNLNLIVISLHVFNLSSNNIQNQFKSHHFFNLNKDNIKNNNDVVIIEGPEGVFISSDA